MLFINYLKKTRWHELELLSQQNNDQIRSKFVFSSGWNEDNETIFAFYSMSDMQQKVRCLNFLTTVCYYLLTMDLSSKYYPESENYQLLQINSVTH